MEQLSTELGTFYYPWTGGNSNISSMDTWLHWRDDDHNPPKTWASNYLPDFLNTQNSYYRLYSSKDTNIINCQLSLMKRAGITFVISSWWGQNHYTDQVLDIIFNNVLEAKNFSSDIKFCIYYEKEGFADVSKSEILDDIDYIKKKYSCSKYYFKQEEKPVVFVYNAIREITDIQKWKEVRDETEIYTVLKVFDGYQNVENYGDSWHQYAPAISFGQVENYSAFVSPGFHKYHESPRLIREDFIRFENDIITLANTNVKFKLIETWNEWGEGTGIEPAQKINHDDVNGFTITESSYDTKYIDIIAKYFKL